MCFQRVRLRESGGALPLRNRHTHTHTHTNVSLFKADVAAASVHTHGQGGGKNTLEENTVNSLSKTFYLKIPSDPHDVHHTAFTRRIWQKIDLTSHEKDFKVKN